MEYFIVEPEVAGGLGDGTVLNSDVHPPIVSQLEYRFDGWLGDVLLESFPCFVLTKAAQTRVQESGLTGADFDDVLISTSTEFEELFSDTKLPDFVWLKPFGAIGSDDFAITKDGRLVLSRRALDVLGPLGIANATIEPLQAT